MYRYHVHIHITSFEWGINHTVSNIALQLLMKSGFNSCFFVTGSQIWLEVQQRRELYDNVRCLKYLQPDHGMEVHAASIFMAAMSQKLYLSMTNGSGFQRTGMASECCGWRTVITEKGSFFTIGKRTNSGVLTWFCCAYDCEKGCLLFFLPQALFRDFGSHWPFWTLSSLLFVTHLNVSLNT